jgi:hypothetical protein
MDEKLKAANEAANQKAAQLSEDLKVKVHPLIFFVEKDKEPVIGFVKEPSRAVKLAVMDKYATGFYSACSQALDATLLKEHSDPRISSERSEDDNYYMGAVYAVSEMISFAANQVDKKK